jgi:hypothetical protein
VNQICKVLLPGWINFEGIITFSITKSSGFKLLDKKIFISNIIISLLRKSSGPLVSLTRVYIVSCRIPRQNDPIMLAGNLLKGDKNEWENKVCRKA